MSSTAARHVMSVGFSQAHRDSYPFGSFRVGTIIHKAALSRFPDDVRGLFAYIVPLDADGPSPEDLTGYDRCLDQFVGAARRLASAHGTPRGVLGLFENSVLPAAAIRDSLGVQGVSFEIAMRFRDKILMKEVARAAGLRVPQFWDVTYESQAAALDEIARSGHETLVVKPVAQAAGAGVARVLASELQSHLVARGPWERLDVEEYVAGRVLMLDGVVRGGQLRLLNVTEYLHDVLDYRSRGAHLGVATVTDRDVCLLSARFAERVLDSLGLKDSTFHIEAFDVGGGELVFLEAACRFGGAGISDLYSDVFGIDIVREAILASLDLPSEIEGPVLTCDRHQAGAGFLWLSSADVTPGRVTSVRGVESLPTGAVATLLPSVGQWVTGSGGIWPTIAKFTVHGATGDDVLERMQSVVDAIDVRTSPSEHQVRDERKTAP